jgi:hypothetical protein
VAKKSVCNKLVKTKVEVIIFRYMDMWGGVGVLVGWVALASALEAAPISFSTNFDSNFPNNSDFTLGAPPNSANFTGGVSQSVGNFSLYHSGTRAWMVASGGTGTIQFERPASLTRLWTRDSATTVDGLVTLWGEDDQVLGTLDVVSASWTFVDFTGMGLVDRITLENVNGTAGSWTVIDDFAATILPGDANGDATVDGLDYLAWAGGFGAAGAINVGAGDFNQDDIVDGLDYLLWAGSFGDMATAQPVPEPTSGLLALLGFTVLMMRRTRSACPPRAESLHSG